MSVRRVGASPLNRVPRLAYHGVGVVTAPMRLRPAFIMVGAQRCGTTSLFRALMTHPQVAGPAFRKGVNYFDLNYQRGERWYRGHFPVAATARRKAAGYGEPVAFEASGYYLYHPFALERLAHDLPAVKLVIMLRDPAERAFSAYKHECARGFESESFEKALELEDSRLDGEIGRMADDPGYESFSHRHHSYRHRGYYAEQLERAFRLFPRPQVHVIDSETYFGQPEQEYGRLLTFLGLRPFEPESFGRYKAQPAAEMAPATRLMLTEHYAPHDERLTEVLGRPLSWNRSATKR